MKKTLLTILLSIPFLLYAQSIKTLPVNNGAEVAQPAIKMQALDVQSPVGEAVPASAYTPKAKKTVNYSFVELGTTYYDLQTNSSPGRRVVLHSDGSISAVWTASPDDGTGYPNRGSGYNYSDGTSFLAPRGQKIESVGRSGWPSIMELDNGKERIIAHESSTGGVLVSTNNAKGSTTFTTDAAVLDDVSEVNVNRVPIWNRSVATNGKIHTLTNYWSSTTENVPVVKRNGVESPTTYSRMDQNGTIEVSHSLLPGYDSTQYQNGGGDNYAIDAKGDVVAIVIGGLGDPVSLWKSTDNGANWTYTDVDSIKFRGPRRDQELMISGDTLDTNDGSLDVMIDATGKVHVFWGRGRIVGGINTTTGDTSFFFFPGQSALMHWQEGAAAPNVCGTMIDRDGDGTLTVSTETFSALDANGNLTGTLLSATRTGSTSLVTMPSASSDANGNLYVAYSAPSELDLHFLNANFRDILVSYSTDGGTTWLGPQNITQAQQLEDNFPCVAKTSNEFLHLVWQQDATPGTNLQNHSASASTHPIDKNKMMYAAVPVADILGNVLGRNLLGTDEINKKAEVFVVSQNQPNPFTGSSDVIIYLRKNSAVQLTVTDMLGNVVNAGNLGKMNAGNHTVSIDANGLSTGMYFYTLSTADHSVTKKMQVN